MPPERGRSELSVRCEQARELRMKARELVAASKQLREHVAASRTEKYQLRS
jgi:hypothetical protein